MLSVVNSYYQLKGDRVVWLIVSLLILFSLLIVYSTAGSVVYKMNAGSSTEYYLVRQIMFIFMGLTLMYTAYKLHYMVYAKLAPIMMILAVPLLIYTFLFGVEINDAARWIKIPFLDISFQTSDFAKLALILYVARSLAMRQDYIKDFKNAFLPIIVPIILICGLIVPNNLSTGALLFGTTFLMMFIGRISLKYAFMLIFFGAVTFGIIYFIGLQFPEYVRVETWMSRVHEFLYSDGEYQVQQSKIAIASGEWFGVGPGNSIQRNILPYAYADFIYAIICEEYGLIGGFAIIGLFLWLLLRSVRLVTRSPKTFGAILAMGLTLNIVVQAFANIAVSVQLVPATGLTFPLISMGGTSFLFTCISLGIILSVSRFVEEAYEEKKKTENLSVADESNH
ncbi:MAG: FtsW/RodA/SpoVE family cell cycle protein [Saprospiraceae bacterium]|nr:FtsW/RodA/SpoVE family cell cycle protein [Saprospiraceae bacterium]MBK6565444.1 FtsW/RodA/SpoVE family cell cycle protein [Saprospiraceae bacterium]MBK8079973.1 FtsW/RodA/SpoVE family cell cycle protein [Saprospiraceae bacterium]MBK8546192.1 FtsW/RodA/SpoVE family cell cycle protein [Saprospiraceae bacterium]MBK8818284.1 FtsW/RodA/SpoVE family cell cycle protein [Saprospiraceae bacterium]